MSSIIKKIKGRNRDKKGKDDSKVTVETAMETVTAETVETVEAVETALTETKETDSEETVVPSSDEDESWTCETCKKMFDDDKAHVIECEWCSDKYCRQCVKIKASEYRFMSDRPDIHWFCEKCEKHVAINLNSLENKINKLEKKLMNCFSESRLSNLISNAIEDATNKPGTSFKTNVSHEVSMQTEAMVMLENSSQTHKNTKDCEVQTDITPENVKIQTVNNSIQTQTEVNEEKATQTDNRQ
jgi:hypothetical protein